MTLNNNSGGHISVHLQLICQFPQNSVIYCVGCVLGLLESSLFDDRLVDMSMLTPSQKFSRSSYLRCQHLLTSLFGE